MSAALWAGGTGALPLVLLDLFAEKAQYRPGEEVRIVVEIENRGEAELAVSLRAELRHLAEVVAGGSNAETLLRPGRQRLLLTLAPRSEELAGFGVDVSVASAGIGEIRGSCAFDVAADAHARIRYGFLSDFGSGELGDLADVELLAKLHINFIQFYDWMYRHDSLVAPATRYADPMGKKIDLDVVLEKIRACHDHGIRAIAYGAVYAATREFYEDHTGWALYHAGGSPYCFIDRFYIMDVSGGSPWSRHIVGQFREAVERLGFDGIHLDTYGFPKSALASSGAGSAPRIVELREELPRLIEAARGELGGGRTLIFNNVNSWPMETTAPAPQDAVYIEVWKPFERYRDLADLVRRAKLLGGGKPVILAAYLEPFKRAASEDLLQGAEQAALLATAVITSLGAHHLLLGEEGGILMQGYYSDHALARPSFLAQLRASSDFIVRYSDLFFDPALADVTGTHLRVELPEYAVDGAEITQSGEGDRVWVLIRESPRRKLITFLNLSGNPGEEWNSAKSAPPIRRGIRVAARVQRAVRRVYTASPDARDCRPQELAHSLGPSFAPYHDEAASEGAAPPAGSPVIATPGGLEEGEILFTELPALARWAILVIDLEP